MMNPHAKERFYDADCPCPWCASLHALLPIERRMKMRSVDLGQLTPEEPDPRFDNLDEQAARRAGHDTGYTREEWHWYLRSGPR